MKDKEREKRLNGRLKNNACMVTEDEKLKKHVPEFTNYEVVYKGSEVLSILYKDPVASNWDKDYKQAYNYVMKTNKGYIFAEDLFDTTDKEKLAELVNILNKGAATEESKLNADRLWFDLYFEKSDGIVKLVLYYYLEEDDTRYTITVPVEEIRKYFTEEFKALNLE